MAVFLNYQNLPPLASVSYLPPCPCLIFLWWLHLCNCKIINYGNILFQINCHCISLSLAKVNLIWFKQLTKAIKQIYTFHSTVQSNVYIRFSFLVLPWFNSALTPLWFYHGHIFGIDWIPGRSAAPKVPSHAYCVFVVVAVFC